MSILLKKNFPASIVRVEDEIHKRLKNREQDSFIYIVPTKRKLRDLQRAFLRVVPEGTAPVFSLFTLETLAARIHDLLCPPKLTLSGPTQSVLLHQAIDRVGETLQYFRFRGKQRWIPQGTFEKIVNVVNVLKEKGVYPVALYAEVDAAGVDEKPKLRDILSIYEEYEKRLAEDFIDVAGIFKEVNGRWGNEMVAELFKEGFPGVNAVFVSGFDEFSDPELTMLNNISELKGIGSVIEFDYDPGNDELFGHLRENYQKFLEVGFRTVGSRGAPERTFKGVITQRLFQPSNSEPRNSWKDEITLLEATDRRDEVELIAKIIKRQAHERPDLDLSKVCVALYQPQRYTALIREAFDRYGIPANITDRFALDQSPLVISLLALLEVRHKDFQLRDVMRALSSPYFRYADGAEVLDPGNLYEIAARLKLSGGYSAWTKRIDQRLEYIANQLSKVDDEVEELGFRREAKELRQAHNDLKYLSRLLHRFLGAMTPEEFKSHVVSLMGDLRVAECLLDVRSAEVGDDQLEKDTRAYQKLLSFLDDFLSILRLQGIAGHREPLAFYVDQMRTSLTQVRYNVRQRYGCGVLVTSLEETRGLQFDVMMIAGLVDGEFPPVYQPEIFFSSARRERMERYHLTEHRYLFYQAMTNFTRHLYLTYPRKDGEIELVPSSFLDALGKVVAFEDGRGHLSEELAKTVYSVDEFLLRYGKSAARDAGVRRWLKDERVNGSLREVLEHLNHTTEVEKDRTTVRQMPEYEGNIFDRLSSQAQEELAKLRNAVFSVTQLESYGRCPFQYFADRVLRLNVVRELEGGLTPLERGGALHEILFEFFIKRRERGLQPLFTASDDEFQQAVAELLSLAKTKIDEFNIADLYWEIDKESLLGTAGRKGVLQEFLELERKRKLEVGPAFFEMAFGPKVGSRQQTDPSVTYSQPITVGDAKIRGKIDRVDTGRSLFTIIDYKTGSTIARRKDIDLGMSLQLPVYLYAVEKILREKLVSDMKGVAGIYYTLTPPVKEQIGLASEEHSGKAFLANRSRQLVQNDDELKAIIDRAIQFVNQYVRSISQGEFPVEPKMPDKVCSYCDFRTVCRIQTSISLETPAQP